METDFIFLFLTLCFLRDGFRKNIELHNRNLLCPILFWSTTVRTIADTESWMIYTGCPRTRGSNLQCVFLGDN
jgi:hypothetical protein